MSPSERAASLVERCIEARRAYFAAPIHADSPALDAYCSAQEALSDFIEGEAAKRAMAERAKRVASQERIPPDLATSLVEDATS